MVIESVVSSFVVGKIRKQKIMNISQVELKGWYFFIIAFFMEISSNIFVAFSHSRLIPAVQKYFFIIHFISYVFVFFGIYKNRDKKSLWLIFAGSLLNFVCIMANGGHMPIWLDGLKIVGLVPKDATTAALDLSHTLLTDSTRLKFLADIIPLPRPYPLPKITSIGDLILAVGVFLFLQDAMKEKESIG